MLPVDYPLQDLPELGWAGEEHLQEQTLFRSDQRPGDGLGREAGVTTASSNSSQPGVPWVSAMRTVVYTAEAGESIGEGSGIAARIDGGFSRTVTRGSSPWRCCGDVPLAGEVIAGLGHLLATKAVLRKTKYPRRKLNSGLYIVASEGFRRTPCDPSPPQCPLCTSPERIVRASLPGVSSLMVLDHEVECRVRRCRRSTKGHVDRNAGPRLTRLARRRSPLSNLEWDAPVPSLT